MIEMIEKAEILMEALPFIQKFYGKIFVIKYGGHAMIDEKAKNWTAQDVVLLKYVGIKPSCCSWWRARNQQSNGKDG